MTIRKTVTFLASAAWAISFHFTQVQAAAPEVLDGVAAVVNGDVITFSQVRELVSAREKALRSTYTGNQLAEKVKEARMGALKDLIDRQLILQEFRKKEFNLPSRVIDERIQQIIREEFKGDRQAFVKALQAQGYTMTRLREIERDKFIVQAMRFSNIKGDLLVSPQKVEEFYGSARKEFAQEEQLKLRLIAISKSSTTGNDPQRILAEEIRGKIAKGGSFDQLARMYSDDSSRSNGGDWGWVGRTTLNPELTKLVFALPVREVSPVMEAPSSYYILMVEEKKAATTKPLTEMRPEIERRLQSEDRNRMTQQWLDGLRQKAFIRIF